MKRDCRSWLLLGAVLLLAGCGEKKAPGPVADAAQEQQAAVPAEDPRIPTQAQPKLKTIKLWVGSQELLAELAVTPQQNHAGLMFRTNLAEQEGMLFVSGGPQKQGFWMKNTSLPLSIAFIDPNGSILEIYDMKPFDTNTVASVSSDVQYILETKQGWFQRHNIGPGTGIGTELGTLQKLFPRQN